MLTTEDKLLIIDALDSCLDDKQRVIDVERELHEVMRQYHKAMGRSPRIRRHEANLRIKAIELRDERTRLRKAIDSICPASLAEKFGVSETTIHYVAAPRRDWNPK